MDRSELQDPYEQADPSKFDVGPFARRELSGLLLVTNMSNWSMNIIVEESRELAEETGATQAQIIRYYRNIACRGVDPIDGSDPLRSLILDAELVAHDPGPEITRYNRVGFFAARLSKKRKLKLLTAFRPLFAVAMRRFSKVVRALKTATERKVDRAVRIARSALGE